MDFKKYLIYLKNYRWYLRTEATVPLISNIDDQLPVKIKKGLQVIWPREYSRDKLRLEPIHAILKSYLPISYYDAAKEFAYHKLRGFPVPKSEMPYIGQPMHPWHENDLWGDIIKLKYKDKTILVAMDISDYTAISEEILDSTDIYCKFMASEELTSNKILPLCLGAKNAKLLGTARKLYLKNLCKKDIDVYGRYGPQTHSQSYRQKVVDMLNSSGLNFLGGFDKIITPEYLKELVRSRISVEVPGFGVLSYRLFESMCLGAVVICKKIPVRFPNPMIDGENFVEIKPDLSDLVDKCTMVIENDTFRNKIAMNAMRYYDLNFSPESVGRRILMAVNDIIN